MKNLLQTALSILLSLTITTVSGQYDQGLENGSNGSVSASSTMDMPHDMIKVYVKQDPATYKKQNDNTSRIDFSVQVSASSFPISEKTAKNEWEGLGPVYVQNENGMYKIRIGPYESQNEAKQVLMEAKSKGRKDAFIVVRQGNANDKSIQKTAKATIKESAMSSHSTEQSAPAMGEYKVRIASYLQPGGFNPEGIDHLGTLESYRKGEWTIMMISGFKTLESAKAAREVVMSKGFNDAAVIVDNNGLLETIVE